MPQKPSRLPPRPRPSRAGFQASCRARARKTSCGRDLAEVEPRGEAARAVGVRVAALEVSREALAEEGRQDRPPGDAPSAGVGDGRARRGRWGARGARPGSAARSSGAARRPAGGDLVGHRSPPPPRRRRGDRWRGRPGASPATRPGGTGGRRRRSGRWRGRAGPGAGRSRPPPRPGPEAARPPRPACAGGRRRGRRRSPPRRRGPPAPRGGPAPLRARARRTGGSAMPASA